MNFWDELKNQKSRTYAVFENFILSVIIINAVITGLMLSYPSKYLVVADNICIAIYCIEIVIRYIIAPGTRQFFTDPVQLFDLAIVISCLIPESLFPDSAVLLCLRIFRMLRITKFVYMHKEYRTIIAVLMKSVISLYRIMALMLIFTYVFAVIGISLFRLPEPETATTEKIEMLNKFIDESDEYFIDRRIDPFGSISESMFTLLKVVSGDDWVSLRNSLIIASRMELIKTPKWFITAFFVVWFIFGAYLLMNLVVGAILQNYEEMYSRIKRRNEKQRENEINDKVSELLITLTNDLKDNKLSDEEKSRFIKQVMDIMKKN